MSRPKSTQPEYTGPPRYWLYRRVSSPGQVDKELSLPAQDTEMRAHVTARSGVIVGEWQDAGITAKTAEARPEFMAMSRAAQQPPRPCDIILFHNSDRVFRNHDDARVHKVLWRRNGVRVESVTQPFVGGDEFSDKILEVFYELIDEEKLHNLSRETVKGQRQAAVSKGITAGRPPYGYDWIDQLQGTGWKIDPVEAEWVRWIFTQFIDGRRAGEITRELNAAGVPSPATRAHIHGRRKFRAEGWYIQSIRHILRNRRYTGRVQYAGEWHPGMHDPIIDDATFDKAAAIDAARGRAGSEHSESLYAGGLALCPKCRASLLIHRTRGYTYLDCGTYHQWAVKRTTGLPSAVDKPCYYSIREQTLDTMLRQALNALLDGVDPTLIIPATPPAPVAPDDTARRRAVIMTELDTIPTERENYFRMRARNMFDDIALDRFIDELETRCTILTRTLDTLDAETSAHRTPTIHEAAAILQTLNNPNLTPTAKRDTLRQWFYNLHPSEDKSTLTIAWRL